jgi:hypothetical protein
MAMVSRLRAGALLAATVILAGYGEARAAEPAPMKKGAVVVAVGDESAAAARPLARDVYREEALRPPIDDAAARVLAGEPTPAGAPAKLVELGELRASVARTGSDAAARRLLASLGESARARIVISVTVGEGGRPVAKVLRVETAAFESVELGATVETTPEGEKAFRWPGAVATLLPLAAKGEGEPATTATAPSATTSASGASSSSSAPSSTPAKPTAGSPSKPSAAAKTPGPLRPTAASAQPAKPEPADDKDRPTWKSPWFWATLGGVAAVGLGIFGIVKATESDSDLVRLQGRIAK